MSVRLLIGCVLLQVAVAQAAALEPVRPPKGLATATFAGGCFWCMEPHFDVLPGVVSTTSGYTGGHSADPSYEQVSAGHTGHAESVQVLYDPKRITFEQLLEVYWRNVDPTTGDRQFCDAGRQYRPAIFYHTEAQRLAAEASKARVTKVKRFAEPIVVEITAATDFYPAEDDHQDYYQKNPIRYKLYRHNCGRDKRLEELWGSGGDNPARSGKRLAAPAADLRSNHHARTP